MTTQIIRIDPECAFSEPGAPDSSIPSTQSTFSHSSLQSSLSPLSPQSVEGIKKAAEIIKRGGLVAFPTETVYGLGADAFNADAVARIFEVKGRPQDNPLIVHVLGPEQLTEITEPPTDIAHKLMDEFWPGPLTIIMKKKNSVPLCTTGGRDTVAVRCPSHAIARELIRLAGTPIAAPSANVSGKPSATDAAHVACDMSGMIDMIIDGGSVSGGLESTIADITRGSVEILRPGSVTREMIMRVCGCAEYTSDDQTARAPGMKYRHYAPRAKAVLVYAGSFEPADIAREVNRLAGKSGGKIGILASAQTEGLYDRNKYIVLAAGDRDRPETVATNLYGALRKFDELTVDEIFCEAYPEDGIGAAVMNRLKKACAGNIYMSSEIQR